MKKPLPTSLTDMQRRYIWLAGSHPGRKIIQGRGERFAITTLYGLHGNDEIVIWGFSDPARHLVGRGLFRKLDAPNTYAMTEVGRGLYLRMMADGEGVELNRQVRQVKVAA
jgi:hypothetical protein